MHSTPVSLLERLREPSDRAAWERFVGLYTPLLYSWACRMGLQAADAADLVQEVIAILLEKMPQFRYDAGRSFRAWLYTMTVNKWRDLCRRRSAALRTSDEAHLEDLAIADPAVGIWEEEYRLHVAARALELMRAEFEPATWKACWEITARGRRAADVAAELGITLAAAYAANSRVLRRLRQEMQGLLD